MTKPITPEQAFARSYQAIGEHLLHAACARITHHDLLTETEAARLFFGLREGDFVATDDNPDSPSPHHEAVGEALEAAIDKVTAILICYAKGRSPVA